VIARVYKTKQIKIGTPTTQFDQDIAAGTIKTGDVEHHHDGGWDFDGQVTLVCDDPVSCHIIAVMRQLITEDR